MRHPTSPAIPVLKAILAACLAPMVLPMAVHITAEHRDRNAKLLLAVVAGVVVAWIAAVSIVADLPTALKGAAMFTLLGAVGEVIEDGFRPRFGTGGNDAE